MIMTDDDAEDEELTRQMAMDRLRDRGGISIHPTIDYSPLGFTYGGVFRDENLTLLFANKRLHLYENDSLKKLGKNHLPHFTFETKPWELRERYKVNFHKVALSFEDAVQRMKEGETDNLDQGLKIPLGPEIGKDLVALHKYYLWQPNEIDHYIISSWILGTYFFPLFGCYPMLSFYGMHNTGKTTNLKFIMQTAFNSLGAETLPSAASLYRIIERNKPTIPIDEAQNERGRKIRALMETAYDKGSGVLTCFGENNEPKEWNTYTPLAASFRGTKPRYRHKSINIYQEEPPNDNDINYGNRRNELEEGTEELKELQQDILKWAIRRADKVVETYRDLREKDLGFYGRKFRLWISILTMAKVFYPEKYDAILREAKKRKKGKKQRVAETVLEVLTEEALRAEEDQTTFLIKLKELTRRVDDQFEKEISWQSVQGKITSVLSSLKRKGTTKDGRKAYYFGIDAVKERARKRGVLEEVKTRLGNEEEEKDIFAKFEEYEDEEFKEGE